MKLAEHRLAACTQRSWVVLCCQVLR